MLDEIDGLAYKIYNDITGEQVANIYYNKDSDKYKAELLVDKMCPTIFNDYINGHGRVIEAADKDPKSEYILNWLKDRVIPPNRDMLKEILQVNGLYGYDWRVLIRLNHGRSTDDYFSVEANG